MENEFIDNEAKTLMRQLPVDFSSVLPPAINKRDERDNNDQLPILKKIDSIFGDRHHHQQEQPRNLPITHTNTNEGTPSPTPTQF